MKLKPEIQQLIDAKRTGDSFTVSETVMMGIEITSLLQAAGIDVHTAVELVHRYRDANWYAGYDAGYKAGADHHE